MLFVDLSAAFDSLIREIVMGARMQPELLKGNLVAVGVEEEVVTAVLLHVREGGVLRKAQVPDEIAELVRIIHDST